MGSSIDYVHKKYAPLLDKTLKNAVAHRIGEEFPRIGGPRMRGLCADLVLDVVAGHLRPREHVTHGQMLWMAVSVNDPPRRGRRIAETDLVPVVLDVSTDQDIHDRLAKVPVPQRQLNKALRLCRQAYEQGGLLSNCDLAELLGVGDSRISHLLAAHEREADQLVPRRATVHDVGTGLTHKRIICRKHYVEGKSPDQVARETYHSLEAVDRYLGQYDRVRHCRLEGLGPEETAQMLNCSVRLVREYLRIDRELEGQDA